MNNLPQPQPETQPTKQLFYNICLMYEFDENTFQAIAKIADVNVQVVEAMFVSVAVRRAEASKVLVAFSEYTGQTWTLSNVKVSLMPTFADLHATHHFDLAKLATGADVPYAILDQMLSGHPVSPQEARLVLQTASRQTSEHYTLETVDVLVIDAEVQHD